MLDHDSVASVFGNYYIDSVGASDLAEGEIPGSYESGNEEDINEIKQYEYNYYSNLVDKFCDAVAAALYDAVSRPCDGDNHSLPGEYPKMETGNLRSSIITTRNDSRSFKEAREAGGYSTDFWTGKKTLNPDSLGHKSVGYFRQGLGDPNRRTTYAYELELGQRLGPYDMAMSLKSDFESVNNITLYIKPIGLIQQM